MLLLLLPVFEFVIYPVLNRCVKVTALRKITSGFGMMAAAFIVAGLVQMEQEVKYFS